MPQAERLGLDPQRLELGIDVYAGYARSKADHTGHAARVIRASCLSIAASFASLISSTRAKELYGQAALGMRTLGGGIADNGQVMHERYFGAAMTLAVCSATPRVMHGLMEYGAEHHQSFHAPETIASCLLGTAMLEMMEKSSSWRSLRMALLEEAHGMASHELGRLRIPFSFVLGAAQMRDGQSLEPTRLAQAFFERLEPSVDAMVSTSHWGLLQGGALPIEPDALACTLVMDCACRIVMGKGLRDRLGGEGPRHAAVYAEIADEFNGDIERGPAGNVVA